MESLADMQIQVDVDRMNFAIVMKCDGHPKRAKTALRDAVPCNKRKGRYVCMDERTNYSTRECSVRMMPRNIYRTYPQIPGREYRPRRVHEHRPAIALGVSDRGLSAPLDSEEVPSSKRCPV